MARKLEIDIQETEKELKQLLHQQPNGRKPERVHALNLLKTQPAESALRVAALMGRNYSTIKKWFRTYRQRGIHE